MSIDNIDDLVGRTTPHQFCLMYLKPIQLEILFWVCQGKKNSEIADILTKNGVVMEESSISYHLGKMNDFFGVKGEGINKREHLIMKLQQEMDILYPTIESVRNHVRKMPIKCRNHFFLNFLLDKLPATDLFSGVEFHLYNQTIKLVLKTEYSDLYYQNDIPVKKKSPEDISENDYYLYMSLTDVDEDAYIDCANCK